MKAFLKGAVDLLALTWLWSLLLVLSITLAVWFFGPLLAVADHRFWQGAAERLLTISVLFLLWGLAMAFVNRRDAVPQNNPETRHRHREHKHLIEHEQKALRMRFKNTLQVLKTSRRYGERSRRWRNDLPWYLLLGSAGSGKTRLLEAGGLDSIEPASPRSGSAACDCEWYFADDGVLVDTAGRYLSQAQGAVDAAGWSALLGL